MERIKGKLCGGPLILSSGLMLRVEAPVGQVVQLLFLIRGRIHNFGEEFDSRYRSSRLGTPHQNAVPASLYTLEESNGIQIDFYLADH